MSLQMLPPNVPRMKYLKLWNKTGAHRRSKGTQSYYMLMASVPMLSLLSNRLAKYLTPFNNTKQEMQKSVETAHGGTSGCSCSLHVYACYLLLRMCK